MLIHTTHRKTYTQPGALCWSFKAATPAEMRTLGEAFAAAVLPQPAPLTSPRWASIKRYFQFLNARPLRIGLGSQDESGLGKSTFAEGMLRAAGPLSVVEKSSSKNQATWHSAARGWLRHYDCRAEWNPLPSYKRNALAGMGLPLTDIVEHPHRDRHNKQFDALVTIKWQTGQEWHARLLTIAVTPELANMPAFKNFIQTYATGAVETLPARDPQKNQNAGVFAHAV